MTTPPLLPGSTLDLMVQKHLLEEWLRNTLHPEGHMLVSLKRMHLREINQQMTAQRRDMAQDEYNALCANLNVPQL